MVTLSQSIITVIGHVNFQSILGFANQDEGSHGKIISKYQSMDGIIDQLDIVFITKQDAIIAKIK